MPRRPRLTSPAKSAKQDQKHLDELLDEALRETFPASDPLAMLELAPDSQLAGELEAKDALPSEESKGSPPGRKEGKRKMPN
jgi:hypothetical protein